MRRLQPTELAPIRAALGELAARSGAARDDHRLHALLLVGLGHSCYEVAGWFGDHPRTIERWVRAYLADGIVGVCRPRAPGRHGLLDPTARMRLERDLHVLPPALGYSQARWSGKLLLRHLQDRYGVRLSLRQCQRMLHVLGGA
jgi:transposase